MSIFNLRQVFALQLSICSLFTCFYFSTAKADDQIRGYLIKSPSGMKFHIANDPHPRILKAGSPNIKAVLDSMENADFISGTAKLQGNSAIILEAIDFVGLRRLLGRWVSDEYFLSFLSFADMTSQVITPKQGLIKGDYKYAVAPSNGNTWKIFFTDKRSVSLGNLSLLDNNHFQVVFFDSRTGRTVKTLKLKRIF